MEATSTRLVEAYRAANLVEAHTIQIALEDAGIPSEIDGDALQGGEAIGWSTAPRVFVAELLVAPAREIIAQAHANKGHDNDVGSNSESLRCFACGHSMGTTDKCPICEWTYQAESDA